MPQIEKQMVIEAYESCEEEMVNIRNGHTGNVNAEQYYTETYTLKE